MSDKKQPFEVRDESRVPQPDQRRPQRARGSVGTAIHSDVVGVLDRDEDELTRGGVGDGLPGVGQVPIATGGELGLGGPGPPPALGLRGREKVLIVRDAGR